MTVSLGPPPHGPLDQSDLDQLKTAIETANRILRKAQNKENENAGISVLARSHLDEHGNTVLSATISSSDPHLDYDEILLQEPPEKIP